MSEVGKNPNDSMPEGKPLDPDTIVSEDDAGSAAIEKELAEEREDDGLGPVDEDEDQPGVA